jgi:hypothetical protein
MKNRVTKIKYIYVNTYVRVPEGHEMSQSRKSFHESGVMGCISECEIEKLVCTVLARSEDSYRATWAGLNGGRG